MVHFFKLLRIQFLLCIHTSAPQRHLRQQYFFFILDLVWGSCLKLFQVLRIIPEVQKLRDFYPSFVLKQKKQKFKAAKKKTAFGLNFDLHQCQVRRGDFLITNRNFPVLLSIDFDLNSFFFEAGV